MQHAAAHTNHKGNQHGGTTHDQKSQGSNAYLRLLAMVGLSFAVMYVLMYAMVDTFGNVFNNVNQVYMAGLMAAPMVFIELALMAHMYRNRTRTIISILVAGLVLVICWFGIRQQLGVGDQQFLRSMIPHHAGAVLMCGKNKLTDPELQQLCREIISSQQSEIELMKSKLE